jgi:hypothetical protein
MAGVHPAAGAQASALGYPTRKAEADRQAGEATKLVRSPLNGLSVVDPGDMDVVIRRRRGA